VTIEEVEEPPEDKVDELTKIIEALKLEKAALEEENRTIKSRNAALERDKQELSSKLEALEKTNKENSQPTLTSIPSKGNFILKIPPRVPSLAESLPQECEPALGGIGR
jgi:chromosome segregation ATPase